MRPLREQQQNDRLEHSIGGVPAAGWENRSALSKKSSGRANHPAGSCQTVAQGWRAAEGPSDERPTIAIRKDEGGKLKDKEDCATASFNPLFASSVRFFQPLVLRGDQSVGGRLGGQDLARKLAVVLGAWRLGCVIEYGLPIARCFG